MAHFYLHLEDDGGFLKDESGADYRSAGDARERAIAAGAAMMADDLVKGRTAIELTLFLDDVDHNPIDTIKMTAAVGTMPQRAADG